MNICFFNNFHRGDIHFSRSFVRHAMSVVKRFDPDAKFYYYHPNQTECVSDIPDLTHVNGRVPHHPGDERYGSIFSADDEQPWPSGPFGKKDDYADEAGSSYKRAKDWSTDKPGEDEDTEGTGYKKDQT
mgnify:CR=1 FL=1